VEEASPEHPDREAVDSACELPRLLQAGRRLAGRAHPSRPDRGRARQWWPHRPRGQCRAPGSAAAVRDREQRDTAGGSYDYTSVGWDLTTNPSAPLSLDLRLDVGGFYNGTRRGGSATLAARHASSLTTSLRVEYNDVRLDQGNFTRTLIATRVAYFFTPRIMLQTLVQYSNQARVWTANARFGWLSTAGTGLFVVFNEGREADGFFQWNQPQARSLIVKYARQFGRSG